MKRVFAAVVAVLFSSGCGRTLADDFRDGVPSKEMVEVQTPGTDGDGQQREGTALVEKQGERAGSYALTRAATVTINGGTLFVLGLVKAITDHRPTTVNENEAVWGPWTGDALDPITWKLTVTRGEESFTYALEGKPKAEGDDAYVVVLSGSHVPGAQKHFGSGSFLLDFDARQQLPEAGNDIGTIEVTYARIVEGGKVNVEAELVGVRDGEGGTGDFSYRYEKNPGQGGSFDFMTLKDVHDFASQNEKLTVHSRWLESGAGRSDYRVTGGDLGDGIATGNECWDTAFNSQYLALSYAPAHNYGVEASACAIVGAEYSEL